MIKNHAPSQTAEVSGGRQLEEVPEDEEEQIQANKVLDALDAVYGQVVKGIPKVSKPVGQFAEDYLSRHERPRDAAEDLVNWQLAKCGTSGFLTSMGGLITLPVAIPANLLSVWYLQLRMVAAIAYMGGYDIDSDQVRTLCYVSLTGNAASDILKQAGVKTGEKLFLSGVKKIPGAVLTKINQAVGFRFVTKFGETGIVNIGKAVPLVRGVVGAAFDVAATKAIAANAERIFLPKPKPVKVRID